MTSEPTVRPAVSDDVAAISFMLQALVAAGKRTRPSHEEFVRSNYVEADLISSTVAGSDGSILGIQVLGRAGPRNAFGVAEGDGNIGTHVHPDASSRGIGRALLAATLPAARRAGLIRITAAIGSNNAEGLGYFGAIGFVTERKGAGRVCKVLAL